jgi:hypothetical protein
MTRICSIVILFIFVLADTPFSANGQTEDIKGIEECCYQ